MRFMMLIKSDARTEAGEMPSAELMAAMGKYNEELIKAGAMLTGEGLHPSSKGARLRVTNRELSVTDGPFAEAKELVAGFWLIQARSLDEAIEWARRVPEAPSDREGETGEIEIRQVFELSDFPVQENESGWREEEAQMRVNEAGTMASAAPKVDPEAKLRFMVLMKANKDSEVGVMPSEEVLTKMGNLMGEMAQKGVLLGGEGLHPSSKAARVLFHGSKRTVVDGPFTEAKEMIAGYALIQVRTREEALEWARRMVMIDADGQCKDTAAELRQVFMPEDFGPELAAKVPEIFEAERQFRERTGT